MASADESIGGSSGGFWATFRKAPIGFLEHIGELVMLTGRTLTWMIRPPYRLNQLLQAMDFIGVQSVFIVSLTGIFSGMVLALQTVNSLRQFGAEGSVGAIVAISMAREIAPVFSALMVTARAGSAMAAELGNMRVSEQIDAIVTMGVSPVQYLLSPRMLAAVLMGPLLCVLYGCIGMFGAWVVGVKLLHVDPGVFMSNTEKYLQLKDVTMGAIKAAIFGFLISAISCNQGFYAKGGARGVGMATTKAVVHSAVGLLVANYFITDWLTDM